ncbi:uncharacterized protein LOC110374978 [Helicoverpa armigera]|uniref:uncharacterized protein LOC110374978 n=1 Tax=Helicoverpa armigera TaxID=29058 RepID=UPI003083BB7A
MFFVFSFILYTVYICETNNFVLKKDDLLNSEQDDKNLFLQDLQYTNTSGSTTRKSMFHTVKKFTKTQSPNPKSRTLDKRLSDEILIKRHIQEKDLPSSSVFKMTKSVPSSTPEFDQKWPVVELLSEPDDFKQYFNEFENKQLHFFHDAESKSKKTEFQQNNNSKDKAIGLRSLPGIHCEDGDQCVCNLPTKTGTPKTTTSKSTMSFPNGLGFGIGLPPIGIPMGVPMGFPMGVPPGYPAGIPAAIPAAIPAGIQIGVAPSLVPCPAGIPHPYYPPSVTNEESKTKKPCHKKHLRQNKLQLEDNLYYEEDEEPLRIDMYEEYEMDMKSRKHKKQHRDDYYAFEEKLNRKPYQKVMSLNKPKDLRDGCNGLDKKYDDTVIKNCYCCSAPFHSVNKVVLILLIFVTFC